MRIITTIRNDARGEKTCTTDLVAYPPFQVKATKTQYLNCFKALVRLINAQLMNLG